MYYSQNVLDYIFLNVLLNTSNPGFFHFNSQSNHNHLLLVAFLCTQAAWS